MSAATAVRLAAQHREHGTAKPKPQGRPAGQFGKLARHRDFLLEIVQAGPDITLKELAGGLAETHGLKVQLSSLHRALERAGLSYKKGLIAADVIGLRCPRPAVIGSRTVNPACARSRKGWFSSTKRRSRQTSRGCEGKRLSGNGSMAPHHSASGVLKRSLPV